MKKKNKKKIKRQINPKKILIGIGCFLGVLLILFILNYVRLNIAYQFQKKQFKESFETVGNKDGYVPQGMAYDETHNIVLQTSYNGKHKPSKLYVVDFKTKKLIKELKLKEKDNSDNHLHVGGVATNGEKVWITSDYQINEYSLEEILKYLKKNVKTINLKPNVMTKEEIVKQVKDIIVDKLGVEESAVTESASFTNDLGADSLDTVELLMEFERVFGIKIPDEETSGIATVGDAITKVAEKIGA